MEALKSPKRRLLGDAALLVLHDAYGQGGKGCAFERERSLPSALDPEAAHWSGFSSRPLFSKDHDGLNLEPLGEILQAHVVQLGQVTCHSINGLRVMTFKEARSRHVRLASSHEARLQWDRLIDAISDLPCDTALEIDATPPRAIDHVVADQTRLFDQAAAQEPAPPVGNLGTVSCEKLRGWTTKITKLRSCSLKTTVRESLRWALRVELGKCFKGLEKPRPTAGAPVGHLPTRLRYPTPT